MALVHCSLDKHRQPWNDSGMLCFQNADGTHYNPKDCLCVGYNPGSEERDKRFFPDLAAQAKYEHTMVITVKDFKREMQKKYGKDNPKCPIEDAHEPIR